MGRGTWRELLQPSGIDLRPSLAGPSKPAPTGARRTVRRLALRSLSLAVLASLTLSCAAIWDRANRGSLQADVEEILGSSSATLPSLTCRMIGSTRSGYCLAELSPDQAREQAQALGLSESIVDLADPSSIPPLVSEGEVGCLDSEVFGIEHGQPVWSLFGRPEVLRLSSGGQFEYLMLIVDPTTNTACIQVSYAYG